MEKSINISLTGEASKNMQLMHRIGIAVFILGCVLILLAYYTESETWVEILRYTGFAIMYLGSILFTFDSKRQFRISTVYFRQLNKFQIIGLSAGFLGFSLLISQWIGINLGNTGTLFNITFSLLSGGILLQTYGSYAHQTAGIKNNFNTFNSLTAKGILGWLLGVLLTIFYIQLYWYPAHLDSLVRLFDPLSQFLRGSPADRWFIYGSLYTFVIVFLGFKFMIKYRHNRYQLIRTAVVIFSQVVFAYFLPQILEGLNYDSATNEAGQYLGYYSANPVNSWPLNYSFFEPGTLKAYVEPTYQPAGIAYLVWGIILFLVVTPVVTYYVGKRWYCSWFCGCGGLAETAGDSFRQLSSKSVASWKIERWVIHSVMVFVLLMTLAILYSYFSGNDFTVGFITFNKTSFYLITAALIVATITGLFFINKRKKSKSNYINIGIIILVLMLTFLTLAFFFGSENVFMIDSTSLKKSYGFFVGAVFSGVIGVGFYPILGNRVWCRFGCPMAGYMGIFQRFKSRFRITTNGGQCISCGNCSTYCEQGIDVRSYAQKGENIVRASCVGCGICSSVCPRGVLKLENGPEEDRFAESPIKFVDGEFKI